MNDTAVTEIEKLDLRSQDVAADRVADLLRLFPEIRTEGGKLDFDRLKLALGEAVDVGKERYGMNWPGKAECFKTIQAPSLGTLRPCPDESVNFDTTGNLIIEGDNLEVLKLLQKSYLGNVKMIYIDPPYNTGNDFIYPDNYSESLQTYLEYTGQVDAEGAKFGTNTESDGRFHSKWMNMMYPRLYLARNLLRDDGVIFISIDDHEADNLKKICNDVFGEENFFALLTRRAMHTVRNSSKDFNLHADYVLVYGREKAWFGVSKERYIRQIVDKTGQYPYDDGDGRGAYKLDPLSARNFYTPYVHTFSNGIKWQAPEGSYPRYAQSSLMDMEKENRIEFARGEPKAKRYLREVQEGQPPNTILSPEDVGFNSDGTRQLREAIGADKVFSQPKPCQLVSFLVSLLRDKTAIVLDFFAGSGTSGQAVLELNEQDGGSRRFILVQLPEATDREDYSTIAEITKERIRGVIKRLQSGGNGQSPVALVEKPDRGFKVFKLAESNFTTWDARIPHDAEALQNQLEFHVDHIRESRSADDILYELLLKSGFPLTTPVEKQTLSGKTIHSIAGGALVICLERELTLELIRAIAERKPERVVCLDEGFAGNDQLKANAVQTCKTKGVVKFQTV